MDRRSALSLLASGLASRAVLAGSPEAAQAAAGRCFKPGEAVPGDVELVDAAGQPVTLASRIPRGSRVVYLLLLGGAHGSRGDVLWCGDSQEEVPLHRVVLRQYAGRGVFSLAVAVPPAYTSRHGWDAEDFLEPPDSERFRETAARFVERSEALKAAGGLPFDDVVYDPAFRLMDNPAAGERAPGAHAPDWQGRFKWCADVQRHGTPTLWLLDAALRVLREPLFGNVYDGADKTIRYGIAELTAALDAALAAA